MRVDSTNIGRAIRNRRKTLGMKQKELASRLHMSANAMCAIENGRSIPALPTLDRIFKALGIEFKIDESRGNILTRSQLQELRQDVILNSLFGSDYQNRFGFPTDKVQDFFDGYIEYLGELGMKGYDFEHYDTIDNLESWYLCFEDDPFS